MGEFKDFGILEQKGKVLYVINEAELLKLSNSKF
jgi:hypothetical protein